MERKEDIIMDGTRARTSVGEFFEKSEVKRRLIEELNVSTREEWCHVR